MLSPEEYDRRFMYHPPKGELAAWDHESIRFRIRHAAGVVDQICPDSREKSLALTKLEEAMMWANAAIARYQDPPETPSDRDEQ